MKVLIVDDDAMSREILQRAVQGCGHECTVAADGDEAWALFAKAPFEVVISDWHMPGMDGLALCEKIRGSESASYTYFILVTVTGGKRNLIKGIKTGADDFLAKPIDPEELEVRLIVASRITQLQRQNEKARERIALLEEQTRARTEFEGIVGKSQSMQELFRRVRLAAQSDVTVLVTGESGTGKELVARAIHRLSPREKKAFLGVNCGAIPDTLLESELFGHTKGAFTGADRDKTGMFEAASGGTLFLDEIGDVTALLQMKLLRALQEREIQRVGDARTRKVDVRIVGATNKDLARMVADGELREDFYYRVKVFELKLPPLRQRREDVPLLVDHFVSRFAEERGRDVRGVTDEAMQLLMDYPWPGNIRELQNAIEHAFVVVEGDAVRLEDLPPEVRDPSLQPEALMPGPVLTPEEEQDRRRVEAALKEAGGSRSDAAKVLGISRVTLWKKMKRYGVE